MKIIWSDRALSDIKNINNYIKQFNPNAAKTIKANIIKSIKKLADFPYSSRQGRVFGTRELVIQDTAYNAVFRVLDSDIEILTIIHQAQNWGD